MPAFAALNFDLSADDEIRRDYDPSKLERDMKLPPLPKILNQEIDNEVQPTKPISETKTQVKSPVTTKNAIQNQTKVQSASNINRANDIKLNAGTTFEGFSDSTVGRYATLHKGTKIWVETLTQVSDKSRRGTRVSMASLYPVSTTYLTVPMGTVFTGKITDSHRPQLGNNGGLIVMEINSMSLNGGTQSIDASVIKVKSKHIFRNNIKGKRSYLKSMYKSTAPGRHFCGKMFRVSKNLAGDGSSIVLAPFAVAMGVFTWGANVIASPVTALFHKGDSIGIEQGSRLRLKLNQDVIIYN